ncbi:MAG: aspartate-semialdehyde dehydrogenase, partial [Proteobacteria bacterium]
VSVYPNMNEYPMQLGAAGTDEIHVGRIRADTSVPHGLNMWIVADNVRKGAALNAVQIAQVVADVTK